MTPNSIDIFCDVIDNFGDIGVVYRFAKEIKILYSDARIRVILNKLDELVKIIGVRNIRTEEQVSYLVENNLLDMVAVGRAMIFTNHWMRKARKSYLKRVENDTK